MCTCKGKDKKPADKQWKEKMQRVYEKGIEQINMVTWQAKKQESKQTNKETNNQENKQKVASARDKCGFGLDVHDFIVLKYGRHTSK